MSVISLNEPAAELVQSLLVKRAARLHIVSYDDGINVPVVDCGVACRGSLSAGIAMAEICTAGLASVTLGSGSKQLWNAPEVVVRTDHPVAACMAAQYAGWKIESDDFFAMGSGPMRAAVGKESLYDAIGMREYPSVAVGALEASCLPSPEVCRRIALECDVDHRKLTLLVAPTASLAGTVQVVARALETALHKMYELKFPLENVVSGWGAAPLPPIAADDLIGIGRTNDAVLYGGRVQLWVDCDDDVLAEIVPKIPSSASSDYGRPFAELFADSGGDFYKIDPMLFSPAWVGVNNLRTGRAFEAGQVAPAILRQWFM